MIEFLKPFDRFNNAIYSNHGAGAAYPRRAVHDNGRRSLPLVLPPLLDASEQLIKVFEVCGVRDDPVIFPSRCLQVSYDSFFAVMR